MTLDQSPGTVSAVVVTVNAPAAGATAFTTHVVSPGGPSFEVDVTIAGVLTDAAFMFVVLGG